MQLAFSDTDRAIASDERLADLLNAASANLPHDPVRSLYFANEALLFAESLEYPDAELRALTSVVTAIHADGRTADSAPYLARAIALAERVSDTDALEDLSRQLGQWAVDLEHTPTSRAARKNGPPTVPLLLSTIARLEQVRNRAPITIDLEEMPSEPLITRRPDLGIEDQQTGLLNARGMTVELLRLEESAENFALIQIAVSESDADAILELATVVQKTVANAGAIARNSPTTLTALLPSTTGIAAMILGDQLRTSLIRATINAPLRIGIGVSIKQPGETSRDVLRRVVDRRDEALASDGVTVVG
jgi:GGDEF domain-containing protein